MKKFGAFSGRSEKGFALLSILIIGLVFSLLALVTATKLVSRFDTQSRDRTSSEKGNLEISLIMLLSSPSICKTMLTSDQLGTSLGELVRKAKSQSATQLRFTTVIGAVPLIVNAGARYHNDSIAKVALTAPRAIPFITNSYEGTLEISLASTLAVKPISIPIYFLPQTIVEN